MILSSLLELYQGQEIFCGRTCLDAVQPSCRWHGVPEGLFKKANRGLIFHVKLYFPSHYTYVDIRTQQNLVLLSKLCKANKSANSLKHPLALQHFLFVTLIFSNQKCKPIYQLQFTCIIIHVEAKRNTTSHSSRSSRIIAHSSYHRINFVLLILPPLLHCTEQ